jgi:hypothetical protein
MKRFGLILFFCFCVNTSFSKSNIYVGAALGGGLSNSRMIAINTDPKIYSVPSFSGGVNAEFAATKSFGIKGELNYFRGGYAYNISLTDVNGKIISNEKLNVALDYLHIPFMFKYSFGDKIRFFVNAGPYFGLLLDYSYTTSKTNQSFMNSNSVLNSNDYGLASGAGLNFNPNKKLGFLIELRNTYGLKNIAENNNPNQIEIMNFSLLLNIGICYSLMGDYK